MSSKTNAFVLSASVQLLSFSACLFGMISQWTRAWTHLTSRFLLFYCCNCVMEEPPPPPGQTLSSPRPTTPVSPHMKPWRNVEHAWPLCVALFLIAHFLLLTNFLAANLLGKWMYTYAHSRSQNQNRETDFFVAISINFVPMSQVELCSVAKDQVKKMQGEIFFHLTCYNVLSIWFQVSLLGRWAQTKS